MPDIYNQYHLFYYYLQILLHHTRDTWAHESDLGQRDCWCNEDNDDENLMQVEGMTGFTQAGCKENSLQLCMYITKHAFSKVRDLLCDPPTYIVGGWVACKYYV